MKKYELAQDPNTSVETLAELAKDENWVVRYWVACNSNTPNEVLKELAKDEYWSIRYCVARNSNISIEIIKANLKNFKKEWFEENPNKELKAKVKRLYEMYGEL